MVIKKKRKTKKKKGFNFKGYVFGALRKIDRWNPERRRALELAKVHDNNLKGDWYTCAQCDTICPRKMVHVDHTIPVVDPKTGFTTWDSYIARLDVPHTKRQVLCKDCHQLKTQAENKIRRSK